MFARRLIALAEKRLALLSELQQDGKTPDAGDLLDAFMTPLLELVSKPDPGAQAFAKLFARTIVEPTDAIREILAASSRPTLRPFLLLSPRPSLI